MGRHYYLQLLLLWMFFGDAAVLANIPPMFFNLPARFTLREDQTVGSQVFFMFAFDFDDYFSPEGRINYILTPIDHTDFKFSVDAAMGNMYLVQSLDYETKKSYTLTAKVSDRGTPPLSESKSIFVTILDVNDNSPSCRAPNVIGSLKEDAPAGSSIATLECTDPDTGDGGKIDYEIVGGDIDVIQVSNTGEATLKREVDYDTEKETFEIDVKVKDRGSPQLFSMAKVILSLADIDDLKPVFSQPGGYTGNVPENSPLGTTVLVITATDGDAPNTDASKVHFGLETTPVPDWINVDPFSGSIVVKGNVDWEMNQQIDCDVYAYSSDRFAERVVVHVTITVDDVNDGIPTFDQDFYELHINESSPGNVSLAIINATDLDDGPDGEVSYNIEGNSIFHIDNVTGLLSLQEQADYEVEKSYLVTVVAKDGGIPATSSSVFVQVSVLPENEFPPVFVAPFTFDVSEDLAPGSSVFTVSTIDGDEGLDGLIGYRVVNEGIPFLIDPGTGVIRVAYSLDFETTTSYNVTIEAIDNSTTIRKSVQQTFLVNILDANDVAAVCESVPTQVLKYPFTIGSPILTIVCTDIDTDASGLKYNVTEGNDGTFKVGDNGHFIMTAPPLKNRYDLTIEVDDGGGQITSVSFIVLTETKLTFQNLPEVIVINESRSLATPPFETRPGYAFPPLWSKFILGNEEQRLILQPGSGEIVFALDFDRDVQENYTFTIEAVSNSGQNATQTFSLRVLDLNDNAPKFSKTVFQFKISENLPVESDVYLFAVTDADSGDNAEVDYSISSGNEDGTFAINSTGWLRIVSPLHYESKEMHVIELGAFDFGSPSLTGTTTVVIVVIDVEQDDPEIISVTGKNEVEISEDAVLGSVVFQLSLPVSDIPDAVTFSILGGNDEGYFGLASTSGKIFLAKMLDRESLPSVAFSLEMAAVNQNGSTVHGFMNITIKDINDNYPIFSKTIYLMEIQHGETAGTVVGETIVTDADEGENANVTLKIIGGNTGNAFTFSGKELKTAIVMDYNLVKSYSLLVQATDNGVPALSSHTVVFVKVIPTASIPRFASPNETIGVEESRRVGTHVVDLDATALGASETDGSLKYEIKSGNSQGHFSIDENSGVLTLVKSLDYENEVSFSLKIVAIYLLDTIKRDEVSLTIDVLNVNEFTPTFDKSTYHWTVSEIEKLNYTVGTFSVTDDDHGLFGEFTTVLSGSDDFRIDSETNIRKIVVAQSLDYLRQNFYTLTVTALDQGIPAKSSMASITIEIIDENNHTPSFTQTNYAVQIYSMIPVGSEVFHVHATDLDTGTYGNISYSIISDSSGGKFSLDSITGIITTAALCDPVTYTLEIQAEDGGSPPETDTATLKITALRGYGKNTAPVFVAGLVADITVNRKVSPGQIVATFHALDVDNDNLTYYIFPGNDDGFFLLDEMSGKLSTAAWLTIAENEYSLVLQAADNGNPSKLTSLTVNIDINPVRTDSVTVDYSFSVSENVGSGHLVGRILVDPGRTVSNYDIISGNHGNAFNVETDISGEGLLKTQNGLDYEDFSLFSIQVQAVTDLRNSTKIVEVTIIDVNDEAPYFEAASLTLSVAEHMPAGHTLTTLTYKDDDFDESNRGVTFSLTNSGVNYLSVDQSGHLTLLISPDFDTTTKFSATVTISQASFTPATQDITVNVLDVLETQTLETPPSGRAIFISLELPNGVDEGFVVHTLTLANFGIDSAASQEFVSFDVAPPFAVDVSTGEITVTKPSVLEAGKSYFRWIVCRTPSQSVMALVRLDVLDRDKAMVVVEFGEAMAAVKDRLQKFLKRARVFFGDTERVGLSLIFAEQSSVTSKRRRLLSSSTLGALYVVKDDSIDELGNVGTEKEFLSQSEILEKLQESGDGTPINGLSDPNGLTVVSVVGYHPSDTEEDPFITSSAGIAMLTVLAVLIVVGGIALSCFIKKNCRSRSEDSTNDPNDKRLKNATITTISGTKDFDDNESQIFRRQGTILSVKGDTDSLNINLNSEHSSNENGPLVVEVKNDDKNSLASIAHSHDENNITQSNNPVNTSKENTDDTILSGTKTTLIFEGSDNPAFSLEDNETKTRESIPWDSMEKAGNSLGKESTFLATESVQEQNPVPETQPTNQSSPLNSTQNVSPTLYPTLEDADENNTDSIIVPEPVTARRGNGIFV